MTKLPNPEESLLKLIQESKTYEWTKYYWFTNWSLYVLWKTTGIYDSFMESIYGY